MFTVNINMPDIVHFPILKFTSTVIKISPFCTHMIAASFSSLVITTNFLFVVLLEYFRYKR